MKILIVGSGGVGGYYGAKLAQSGNELTFIARGNHLKAMQENGLSIISPKGDFKIDAVKAIENISEATTPDLVIIATKAWQVTGIAKELKSIISPETIILPLQNGVMAADEIAVHINKNQIIGGLTRIISKIENPGIIRHVGVEPTIVFGDFSNKKTEIILAIKELFDKAEISSIIANDIEVELWKKFNAICISGLMAITHSCYGILRELPETRKMAFDLLTEIYTIGIAKGLKIEDDFVVNTMNFHDSMPYESTFSLSRDVWEGKPSEIDYQNGSVVKFGKQFGIPTPVNEFIYNTILPMELKARKLHGI